MSAAWPPLDTHAHVATTVSPTDLLDLRAVVFAASRSLTESRIALDRQPRDLLTVWGVGVHPGLPEALKAFDPTEFASLLGRTAYIGEIGLDGKVKSRLGLQRDVLDAALEVLQRSPRMTSIHSYAATAEILDALERTPIQGAVLHWWKGNEHETRRAVEMGAHFSVNTASLRDPVIGIVPLDRLLLETDHPDGNRYAPALRRPGALADLESALGPHFGVTASDLRVAVWSNLRRLCDSVGAIELLPPRIRAIVQAAPA